MGRVFKQLEKRVEGRHSSRDRFVRNEERLRSVEVALYELLHYTTRQVATNGDSPADVALTQAAADYEQTLERTVK